MKQHWKRNLTVLTVVLFVAAAVYFNWSYNQQFGAADADMVMAEDDAMEKAGVKPEQASEKDAESNEPEEPVSDYFAQARLTRQQSRDDARNLLEAASSADGASQETIDSAMTAIAAMASDSMTETRIENLLLAKGYADCVAYITGDSISVAVPSPADGLTEAQVAAITDVITSDTEFAAAQLKVVEVKSDP
jgi:stage III sporulation protein AH